MDENILKCLLDAGIKIVGNIVQDIEDKNKIFVHIPVFRDSKNKQNPSNKQLKHAEKSILQIGFNIEFLLSDSEFNHIESGLRATLFLDYEPYLRNIFLSFKEKSAYVWIEEKKEIPDDVRELVEKKSRLYLSNLDLKLESISNTVTSNLPGKLACLNTIRRLAPAVIAEIEDDLIHREFVIPSRDWLSRRLDALRKDGSILRLTTSTYVLSQKSLLNLGTSHEGKSPDLSKLLALARMGG